MISICSELKTLCPQLRLGTLSGRVQVSPLSDKGWESIEQGLAQLEFTPEGIREHPVIASARQGYKALKKDPSRYRLSAEALRRRVMKSKDLYRINNVVDIINWVSISSGFSIGGYDKAKIIGDITLKRGDKSPYEALGRGQLNIENLPVLYDSKGPFGSPTSDSLRTSMDNETQDILWVFFDFGSGSSLDSVLQGSVMLLEALASATEIKSSLVS